MTAAIHTDVARRHDFVLLFDVTDGNPNGDPDAGNLPRVDPETMQGLVSDVAIKRKVRNYVDALHGHEERFKIYIQSGVALNDQHRKGYEAKGIASKGTKQQAGEIDQVRRWMCDNFYDIRSFGAVMTTGVNAGQVRGPVQVTFARSADPIVPLDLSITRITVTKPEDMVVVSETGEASDGKQTEMGRKALVPYGLYRAHGFVVPAFAAQTGFSSEDLTLLWAALVNMWDLDRSASRGLTSCRGLYVFSHENGLGNAPAHRLFERVVVGRANGAVPRSFGDYAVTVDEANLPPGVTLTRLEG
jgi:CRISPR-associated protein Csd2